MVERTVQSLVRDTAMVLSSAPDSSFDFVGKYRAFTLAAWWRSDPISRFLGFSIAAPSAADRRLGRAAGAGRHVERL